MNFGTLAFFLIYHTCGKEKSQNLYHVFLLPLYAAVLFLYFFADAAGFPGKTDEGGCIVFIGEPETCQVQIVILPLCFSTASALYWFEMNSKLA